MYRVSGHIWAISLSHSKNMLVLVKIAIFERVRKIKFANMLKIVQKSRKLPDFWKILTYLQNCFLLSNLTFECLHTQIMKFHKVFITG